MRSLKLENIRALAIVIVVLGHSIILYSSSWNIYETTNKVVILDYLKKGIDLIQMPLYFSLSGYLFLFTHKKNKRIKDFIISKIKRLIIPFICISLFYLVPIRQLIEYSEYKELKLAEIIKFKILLCEDVGHLWFLPALFLVFIISEIVLKISEKINLLQDKGEIVLYVISGLLYFWGYRINLGYASLAAAYSYMIWFSVGYFINTKQKYLCRIYIKKRCRISLIMLSMILSVYCIMFESTNYKIKLLTQFLILVNLYQIMPHNTKPFFERISKNSFGIYLFHSPLVYITYTYIPNVFPIMVIAINFIIGGSIAFFLTDLMRKTKFHFLIGE